MFTFFPATLTTDGRKVPIKEVAPWQDNATSDQNVLTQWTQAYGHKIKFWAVPTGIKNGILVLDVDVKGNGYETLKNYHLPQTLTQTTMSGGKHYIYKYPNDGKLYGNRAGFDAGLDVRGEGGYIIWYNTSDHAPIADAPQWLLDVALGEDKNAEPVDPSKIVQVSFNIVQAIMEEACSNIRNAPQGESNNVLNMEAYRIGQLIGSNSIDRNYAFNELFKAAKERGKPDYEAKATIESGFKGGASQPFTSPFTNEPPQLLIPEEPQKVVERWTPQFLTRSHLTDFTKLKKPQLFKDWSSEDITIVTADGGTGKTTLDLNEAIALALGESFLGFECVQEGRTLFITGEDTSEKLAAMLGAILKQRGLLERTPENDAKVQKILGSILIKKDIDLRLVTKNKEGYIVPAQDALKKVLEAIEDFRPRMIVFDPIASFWGRESDNNDMTIAVAKFMGILVEKSNACVKAINHMGKASSTSKDMSQFAGRGGTGLPSHARVSRVLRPVYEEEFLDLTGMDLGDKSAIMCNVNKFSDGSPLYNKPFLILRDGYLFERVVLTEKKEREVAEKMTDVERVFAVIHEERNAGRYPTKEFIIARFAMSSDKLSKDRVSQALTVLLYQGHMGEKIKFIENPDVENPHKAIIITGHDGKEVV